MTVRHFVDAKGDSRYLAGIHSGDINDPFVPVVSVDNSLVNISLGYAEGFSSVNKFGRRTDVDTNDLPAFIWNGDTNNYSSPSVASFHEVVSTSSEDIGTNLYTGTITQSTESDGVVIITDVNATYQTDGVSAGATVINSGTNDHTVVVEVLSETQMKVLPYHHGTTNLDGAPYYIVTSAGTGTGLVHIVLGLDEDMNIAKEFVILNGTTPVLTSKKYLRISRVHADHNGSNKSNVGDITLTSQDEGTVTSFIGVGLNQTYTTDFTIPAGHNAALHSMYISLNRNKSTSGAMASFQIMVDRFAPINPIGPTPISSVSAAVDGSSFVKLDFDPPIRIEERSDISIICTDASDSNLVIDAGYGLILHEGSISHNH